MTTPCIQLELPFASCEWGNCLHPFRFWIDVHHSLYADVLWAVSNFSSIYAEYGPALEGSPCTARYCSEFYICRKSEAARSRGYILPGWFPHAKHRALGRRTRVQTLRSKSGLCVGA